MSRWKLAIVVAALAGLAGVGAARADGQAGLVIDYGNGNIQTYCIGFTGDSIRGDDLLARAGKSATNFSGLVCSIDGTGCADSGSFGGCLCECQEPGGDCTYWAFFTQTAGGGGWRYSSLGFRAESASDGEMHAWKWGEGQANSAPAPVNIPFSSICTASVPTATTAPPTSPPATTAPATSAPATTAPGSTAAPGTQPPGGATASATSGGFTPAPPGDLTITPGAVSTGTSSAPTSVIVGAGTVAPTTVVTGTDSGDGGGRSGLATFAGIALVLGAAIGGAAIWRARNGA